MGQPVNLVPNNERAFGCEPENPYCTIYALPEDGTENIVFQMKQTPCGNTIVSNGVFNTGTGWTADANIVFADNKAVHVSGVAGTLTQTILAAFSLGDYFKVSFTVTGLSDGFIELFVGEGGAANQTITENGIYTFYIYPDFTNNDLSFIFSALCNGGISNVSVYKMVSNTEVTAKLNDSNGNTVRSFVVFTNEDYITFVTSTFLLDPGCYSVLVIDECVINPSLFTEIFTDTSFANAMDWTVVGSGCTAVVSGGKLTMTAGALQGTAKAIQPFNFPYNQATYFIAEFSTGAINSPDVWAGIFVDGLPFYSVEDVQPNTTYTIYGFYGAPYFNGSELEMDARIFNNAVPTAGQVNELLSVSVKVIPAVDLPQDGGVYTSNCLKMTTDVSHLKVVEGFCEFTNTTLIPNTGSSLGFLFIDGLFWLRARLGVQFSNPHTPTSTDNNLSSNGRTKKAYAQLSKAWDLTFHAVDENMHDTIANIINCDSFQIEGNEYVTDEKEYTANYGENGINAVAESTIEVQKVDGTRFNTNQ